MSFGVDIAASNSAVIDPVGAIEDVRGVTPPPAVAWEVGVGTGDGSSSSGGGSPPCAPSTFSLFPSILFPFCA